LRRFIEGAKLQTGKISSEIKEKHSYYMKPGEKGVGAKNRPAFPQAFSA